VYSNGTCRFGAFQTSSGGNAGLLERRLLRRDGITIEHTPDAFDEVQYAADREFAIRQLEQDSDRFRDVNAGLRRIEGGSYGACLHCGSAISIIRLKAVPWTSCCIDCQDVAEQTKVEVEPLLIQLTQPGPKAMLAGESVDLDSIAQSPSRSRSTRLGAQSSSAAVSRWPRKQSA
jgi:DnaK suppressor protein